MVKFLKEKTDLTRISSVLSLFTLVAFHWPFFRLVLGNIEGGFNGVLITGGLGVLMFALNFLVYYLVLFLGRFVGKCILAFTFIGNAISLYFINTYQVLITDKMMGNVFNTGIRRLPDSFHGLPYGISSSWAWFHASTFCKAVRLRKLEAFFRPHGHRIGGFFGHRAGQYAELAVDRPQRAQSSAVWSCRGRIRSIPYATIIP